MESVRKVGFAVVAGAAGVAGVFSTHNEWPEPLKTPIAPWATVIWALTLGTIIVGLVLSTVAYLGAATESFFWQELMVQSRVAGTHEMSDVHALAEAFFGGGVSSVNRMKSWSRVCKRSTFVVETIKSAERRLVGYFCILPLKSFAVSDLLHGRLTGAGIEARHLSATKCEAIYLGALGASGARARHVTVEALTTELRRQLLQTGATHVYTRPITKRGLALAQVHRFSGLGSAPLRLNELAVVDANGFLGAADNTGSVTTNIQAAADGESGSRTRRPFARPEMYRRRSGVGILRGALAIGLSALVGVAGGVLLTRGGGSDTKAPSHESPAVGKPRFSSAEPTATTPPPGAIGRAFSLMTQRGDLPTGDRYNYHFWLEGTAPSMADIATVVLTGFEHDGVQMNGPVAWTHCGDRWKRASGPERECSGRDVLPTCGCRFVLVSEQCVPNMRLIVTFNSGEKFEKPFDSCRLLNESRRSLGADARQLDFVANDVGRWTTTWTPATVPNRCPGDCKLSSIGYMHAGAAIP